MKKVVIALFVIGLFLLTAMWSNLGTQIRSWLRQSKTVSSIEAELGRPVHVRLEPFLQEAGFKEFPKEIKLQAFKEEQILEVWGKNEIQWTLIKTYPFTAFSGQLGPKLREGDRQIPEGVYQIEYLNPNSAYHLSLKVSYPNAFDKKKAHLDGRTNLGGDIFIHGKAVTIGCIPIGDEGIEEVFLLASNAIIRGIPVIIAPRDLRKGLAFPEIRAVDWEEELYRKLKKELVGAID